MPSAKRMGEGVGITWLVGAALGVFDGTFLLARRPSKSVDHGRAQWWRKGVATEF